MATKKTTTKKKTESVEVPVQIQDTPEVQVPVTPVIRVLSRYRVEKVGNDAHVFERIRLTDDYAGQKGVLEFNNPNGTVTYYAEKLVKKYSENVVKA
jgi:hypothetical protein